MRRLRPDYETEATAMRVVMEHERAAGRTVTDVHETNLWYDISSLDPTSGELRLIEVKGIGEATGRNQDIRALLEGGLSLADIVTPRTRPERAGQLSLFADA